MYIKKEKNYTLAYSQLIAYVNQKDIISTRKTMSVLLSKQEYLLKDE